ncbi:MAG: M3 family metallopeptidase, partial [Muribaculaceae bacterium]|nr:M3 family metallopeptidase [Muribaculaceae bacterium]
PWDYSFYSTKLKNAKYSYDEEAMRPYFQLDNVIDGVFGLATKLYGLKFTENKNIPVYHPDVKAFDVNDADGSYIGVIYTDFFPRETKRAGAWMTEFRGQKVQNGEDVRPHVTIVMNFTKPTADEPSLLTPYEVETFLHEFGHALHGLLSKCNYQSLAGTNVYRDFVELPSQFNENYLTEKEFLDGFARHYKTGEPIPQELIDKLVASSQYGAAYACLRQLMFGLIDMKWHSITEPVEGDAEQFENDAYTSVALFTPIPGTMTSTTFSHIFSGGYAAGYYSYKWAEVLDADAFAKFKEDGIFNQQTAKSFRENILERGGSENPALLYRRFRGAEPSINALLERDGIKPINVKSINKDM